MLACCWVYISPTDCRFSRITPLIRKSRHSTLQIMIFLVVLGGPYIIANLCCICLSEKCAKVDAVQIFGNIWNAQYLRRKAGQCYHAAECIFFLQTVFSSDTHPLLHYKLYNKPLHTSIRLQGVVKILVGAKSACK